MTRTMGAGCALMLCVLLLGASSGMAQTNAEVNAGIQFNFSTPGARSLGLGGAFIGLADDATAAYTNPAGLMTLSRPEISFEGRQWDFTSTFTDRGHVYPDDPSGGGEDTIAGLRTGEASSDTTGLSFLSFVYPRDKWAVAFYRHELANFETSYNTQGAFIGAGGRFFPVEAAMELDIVNYGVSAALRVHEKFTLGAGVSYYTFDINSVARRYDIAAADVNGPGGFRGIPDYSAGNLYNYQEQTGDDTKMTLNLGFLWNLSPKVSLGGVLRKGPEFEFNARSVGGPSNPSPGVIFTDVKADFNVPDVIGLGFAFRPTDAFTIALDWARVQYKDLTADTVNLFTEVLDPATARLTIDDGDEIHLGFEYVFVNAKYPVALRFGTWYDPDHKIRFDGDPGDDAAFQQLAALFRPGDDEYHYSAGIGFIFGEKFQLDAAVDMSDAIDTMSLSGVFRF